METLYHGLADFTSPYYWALQTALCGCFHASCSGPEGQRPYLVVLELLSQPGSRVTSKVMVQIGNFIYLLHLQSQQIANTKISSSTSFALELGFLWDQLDSSDFWILVK
jgi:hypothetical protein